jgi:WXG100 family type VII secretion target
MTESLSVNPDDMRTAAANVADISSEMKQVLSTLKGQLAALGSPWGNDSTGDQFANGSNGYLAQVDNVDSSIDATTQQLDSLSQSLTAAASNFDHQDQQTGGGTGNVLLGMGSGGASGGSGGGSGSGGSGGGTGSGGAGGPGQVLTTTSGLLPELPRIPATSALLPETPAVPAQPAQPAIPAGNGSAQLSASGGVALSPELPRIPATSALLPETPAVPAQPAQPAIPANELLASGSATGAGTSGELSPVLPALPGTPEVPAVPPVPTGVMQPANSVVPGQLLSAVPSQPATAANVLTSGVEAGATSASTPAFGAVTPVAATPALPATAGGNVLASVVPGAGGSIPGSGISALIQEAEQLAQPAGEGVSTAMGAIQSGSKGSGTPGGPPST